MVRILPQFMQEDMADNALAKVLSRLIRGMDADLKKLSVWDQLDAMTDEELDELAWELDVTWYSKDAEIETKRQLIRDSDLVKSRAGTNWAVEQVISTYLGSGEVVDWYDYGGAPGHFKIVTENAKITGEDTDAFVSMIRPVKRLTAVLDCIEIQISTTYDLILGCIVHDIGETLIIMKEM